MGNIVALAFIDPFAILMAIRTCWLCELSKSSFFYSPVKLTKLISDVVSSGVYA